MSESIRAERFGIDGRTLEWVDITVTRAPGMTHNGIAMDDVLYLHITAPKSSKTFSITMKDWDKLYAEVHRHDEQP